MHKSGFSYVERGSTVKMTGFFRIFRRHVADAEIPVEEVRVEELPDWIERIVMEDLDGVKVRSEDIFRNMNSIVLDLRAIGESLSEVRPRESMYGRPRSTIQASKDAFSRKLVSIVDKFGLPEVNDFNDLLTLRDSASEALRQFIEGVASHGRYVAMQFSSQVKEVKTKVRRLDSCIRSLTKIISEAEPRFKAYRSLMNQAEQLKDKVNELEDLSKKKRCLSEEIEVLDKECQHLIHELENLKKSSEYVKSIHISRELNDLRAELHKVRQSFEQDIIRLAKPLRKYEHSVSMDRSKQKLLHNYMNSPCRALIEDKDFKILGILFELRGQVETGRIEVKRSEKTLSNIDKVISSLRDYPDHFKKLEDAIKTKEKLLRDSTSTNTLKLEEELQEKKKTLEEKRSRLIDTESLIETKHRSIGERIIRFEEEILQKLVKKVRIPYQHQSVE